MSSNSRRRYAMGIHRVHRNEQSLIIAVVFLMTHLRLGKECLLVQLSLAAFEALLSAQIMILHNLLH